MSSAALIARARGYSAEFGHCLANHLPMCLVILERLGASRTRQEAWCETYAAANGLAPAPEDGGRINASNWQDHLGRRELEGDYRGFFLREVQRVGADDALRRYLPVLVPGIAASALHALMRLAYGHLSGDEAEIGIALGYWAATWLPLRPADAEAPATDDPAALLAALRDHPELCRVEPPTDLLWHWMRAVAAEPAFPDVAALLGPSPDLLARVAKASLALMAGTMTFEAVHAVTSAHWLRILRQVWPDEALAVRYVWQAIAAVYPKIGAPALPSDDWLEEERRQPCPDWAEIRAKAIASDDEHDLSFTFSALEEGRCYGDRPYPVLGAPGGGRRCCAPLFQGAAARRMGLIP